MNIDHLQQCAEAGYEAIFPSVLMMEERLAFARAAISTYLKLNPVWVKASERMPTEEDADQHQGVVTFVPMEGFGVYNIATFAPGKYYWTSIKHLPPPPDPFEDWLAQQPDDVRAADKELVKKIYNLIKQ
jgi:hypothetical protein